MGRSNLILKGVALGFLLSLNGCNSQDTNARLLRDVRRYKDSITQPAGPSWVAALADKHILSVLTNSHVRDLDTPRLVVPILGIKSNDTMLAVFWTADEPSIAGVELIAEDGSRKVLPIPDLYKTENEKDAKDGVVFRSVYRWTDPELPPILRTKCSLRLLGTDTNAMPLVVKEVK